MRKIRLHDTDEALFSEEMLPTEFDFLHRHKDTFCRMWREQGRVFWKHYVEVFRSYIVRYSALKDLVCDVSSHGFEYGFTVINTNFLEGKVNQAKSFLYQIADLGKNHHRFVFLDSRSVTKDPFYTKDTRDVFRELFGKATEKSSYIKVYLLTPMYMRFGGSVIRCLCRWIDAEELDPLDQSYYTPPLPLETKGAKGESDSSIGLCDFHWHESTVMYYVQFLNGAPRFPVCLDFWGQKDPRFSEPNNPLFDLNADVCSDWRDKLSIERFREFYSWCIHSNHLIKPEERCEDCQLIKKKKKKKKKKAGGSSTENGDNGVLSWTESGASAKVVEDGSKTGEFKKNRCVRTPSNNTTYQASFKPVAAVASDAPLDWEGNLIGQSTSWSFKDGQQVNDLDLDGQSAVSAQKKRTSASKLSKLIRVMVSKCAHMREEEMAKTWYISTLSTSIAEPEKTDWVPIPLRNSDAGSDPRVKFMITSYWNPTLDAKEVTISLEDIDLSLTPPNGKAKKSFVDHNETATSLNRCGNTEDKFWAHLEMDCTRLDKHSKDTSRFIVNIVNFPDQRFAEEVTKQLVNYIVLRKSRPCPGWVMSEVDISAFCQCLGSNVLLMKGVIFYVRTGSLWFEIQRGDDASELDKQKQAKREPQAKAQTGKEPSPSSEASDSETGNRSAASSQTKADKSRKKKADSREAGSQTVAMAFDAGGEANGDSGTKGATLKVLVGHNKAADDPMAAYLRSRFTKLLKESELILDTNAYLFQSKRDGYCPFNLGIGARTKSVCAHCQRVEPMVRCYKKCSKCVEEKLANVHYYCNEKCQGDDWKSKHGLEHAQKQLQ